MRILAMDDSRLIHQLLGLLLKPVGACLDLAASAPAALEHIHRTAQERAAYDCFLLDLNCPGFEADPEYTRFGGYQMVSLLRQDTRRPALAPVLSRVPPTYTSTPILVFTSEKDPALLTRVKGDGDPRLGATHVLGKSEYLNVNNQTQFIQLLKTVISRTFTHQSAIQH